jgi:hypothetical protein
MNLVKVNVLQSERVGHLVGKLAIRKSFFNRPFLNNQFPVEQKLSMIFNAVAICHQTHNLYSQKKNLFGWDYIEDAFVKLALSESPLLNPDFVVQMDSDTLKNTLLCAFSDTGLGSDSTLDTIDERARLYMGINQLVVEQFEGSFLNLLKSSTHALLNHGQGFYELLSECEAFADPQRKKSSFLFKLLFDAGLFSVSDEDLFVPIVDYHMQRVLLRLGCIEVLDGNLDLSLRNRLPLKSDLPVRQACSDAFKIIAETSGMKIWAMNDVFWPLGRSCCNQITLCSDHRCSKNPCTFEQMIELETHVQCFFGEVCLANQQGNPKAYYEPNVTTHYY